MIFESRLNTTALDTKGAYKDCAVLCPNCPRRTGEINVRAKGISGQLGKRITREVHSSPIKSGELKTFQTNGRHGAFFGEGSENTGTVANLREDTAEAFVEAVIGCRGPIEHGNVCKALGERSLDAIYDLDTSMEHAIDTLPLEEIIQSVASDSTKPPATELDETQVFVNISKPTGVS